MKFVCITYADRAANANRAAYLRSVSDGETMSTEAGNSWYIHICVQLGKRTELIILREHARNLCLAHSLTDEARH